MASVYTDILNAVKARIEEIPSCPTVDIRKAVTHFGQADELPRILVVIAGDVLKDEAFDNQIQIGYGVLVVILYAGNKTFTDGLANVLDLRQAVRRKLNDPTITGGSTTSCEVEMVLNPVYELGAMIDGNYEVSSMKFTYWVAEPRN